MMIFLLVAAALVAIAPLLAAVLVTVASLREDAAKSLAGRPRGPLQAVARRLLQASVGGGSGSAQRRLRVAELLPGWRIRPPRPGPDQAGPVPVTVPSTSAADLTPAD
jgi:hypothetical protein